MASEACEDPNYFTVYNIIYGVVSIILGFLLCFFGYRLLHASLFLAGVLFAGGITYLVIQGHEYSVTDNIQEWELILIGLAVGAVVGIVVMFLFKIGFFLIGALAGAFVGVILLSLREGGLVQGDVSAWAIIGCFALIGGILAVLPAIEKLVLVATTSVVGSFGVTAAIDYYANCMAFTGILQQMVSTGDYDPATVTAGLGTWLLFGGTIVLVILGIVVQLFFTGAKHKFVPLANCCSGKSKGGYESI